MAAQDRGGDEQAMCLQRAQVVLIGHFRPLQPNTQSADGGNGLALIERDGVRDEFVCRSRFDV